ncbi:MAG TPA: histidine kinase [Gemmatimonadaceae bacterium]|nr:histidine kinase [Gemmatimonadaceae bacterium]
MLPHVEEGPVTVSTISELETSTKAAAADLSSPPFRLSRRELVLIVAFWTFMAALTFANRLLDPRQLGLQFTNASAPIALALLSAYSWALLTPLIFWLSSRFLADHKHRVVGAVILVAVGFAIAVALGVIGDDVRSALTPFPPRRGRGGPPGYVWLRPWYLNDFIIYLGVLAAGLARAYSLRYRRQREESLRVAAQLRAQLAEARLDALRMQLDPHFLFNTLHAISSLVERDPRGVRRMISRLSELLRHTIEGPGDQEITLREEFELLRRYLEIMEVRFQGRLEITTDVQERAMDALVPNLILQPIVENAIKHGVARIEGIGHITLRGRIDGGQLLLCVENNAPPSEVGTGTLAGTGVGVRNTRARLSHLYGDEQSFELRAEEGPVTIAEIRLPYHTRADLRTSAVVSIA